MNLLLAAAAAAQAFNLTCSGVSTSTMEPVPFSKTFRVDLANGRWCENACKTTHAFFAVTDNELIFLDKVDNVMWVKEWVDRNTGEYVSDGEVHFTRTRLEQRGKCTKAAFSGMPETIRQF